MRVKKGNRGSFGDLSSFMRGYVYICEVGSLGLWGDGVEITKSSSLRSPRVRVRSQHASYVSFKDMF